MHHLRSLALAAAMAAVGSQALAGGFAPIVVDPAPEPVVVVEPEAPRSTFGLLLPLLLLGALVAVAVANDEEDEGPDGECDNGIDMDDDGVCERNDFDDEDPDVQDPEDVVAPTL